MSSVHKRKRYYDRELVVRDAPTAFIDSGFSHIDGSPLDAQLSDVLGAMNDEEDALHAQSQPIVIRLGLSDADTARVASFVSMMHNIPPLEGSMLPSAAALASFEPLCTFISMRVRCQPAASERCMSLAQLIDVVQRAHVVMSPAIVTPYMVAVACVTRGIARQSTWTAANANKLSCWMLNACMWDCVMLPTLALGPCTLPSSTMMQLLEVARFADVPVMAHGCSALLPFVERYMTRIRTLSAPFTAVDARTCMGHLLVCFPEMARALILARTADVCDGLCLPVKACAPVPSRLFHLVCCTTWPATDMTDEERDEWQTELKAESLHYAWMFVCASVVCGQQQLHAFCLETTWTTQYMSAILSSS